MLCESAHPQRAEILKVLSSNYAIAFLETDEFNLYAKHGKVTSTRFPLPAPSPMEWIQLCILPSELLGKYFGPVTCALLHVDLLGVRIIYGSI